ncbi:hypothetical protein N7474_006373 [Penicillium riverlandense]|uniref:uncharacterized protein n=1 Tax=Penicillium riverlandense TaxID=1903569 RepID=UPI002548D8DA|nr:uncharacterized protein N7474_006373 [Penicillium riverlandense]KAJ5814596.1 hypothetical protein N7474_006373 [Penicillium riverlandense]
MAHTLYDSTVAVAQSILGSLSHILLKAEQHPNASTLLEARLYSDMFPLSDQVRIATQYSENLVARMTSREPVTFDRDLTTFAKCYERIETVLKALHAADKDLVNQHAEILGTTKIGPEQTIETTGAVYANTIALPNIYFHLVTAYGILRKEGVSVGKRDYYAGFYPDEVAGNQ